jgi:hypothetical protein
MNEPDGPSADRGKAAGPVPAEYIFSFANTRDAIEGEKKLLAVAIPAGVMPLPDQIGAGCGICLRVSPGDLERARTILAGSRQGIYAVTTRAGPGGAADHPKKVFTPWNP